MCRRLAHMYRADLYFIYISRIKGASIRPRKLWPLLESYECFMSKEPIYKVIFYNQNQVYEVYARAIYQSEMYGFIEVEEFVFGERSQLLVDPSEERLKTEFASVKRSYIPMHSIIRIDEVEKEGAVKVTELKAGEKAATIQFPTLVPSPKGD